jgi:RNA ligase
VPDEFYNWVKATERKLNEQFKAIEVDCKSYFKTFETRKETAAYFLKHPHSGILFNMLNGKDYSKAIWKKIKPEFQKPFTNGKDEF